MFSYLSARNFLSWEKLEFQFQKGITMVTGFNYDDGTPEGSGKSAVLNALCFALFGKLPKDSKVDDVIRDGEKHCEVSLILQNGIRITRSRHPNSLHLQQSYGNEQVRELSGKDAKETQTKIEEVIGMGFETFCQSVYFAQNYPNKFITANEDEKAKILSEITGISVFDKARKKAHELRNEVDVKLTQTKSHLESIDREIESLNSEISNIRDLQERVEEERKARINGLEKQIESTATRHKHLEGCLFEAKKDLDLAKEKQSEREARIEQLQGEQAIIRNKLGSEDARLETIKSQKSTISKEKSRIEKLNSEIEAHKNPRNKTCPTCGTVLEKIDKSVFADKISELEQEVAERTQEVVILERNLKALTEVESSTELRERLSDLSKQATATKALLEKARTTENLVTKYTAEDESFKKEIRSLFQRLEAVRAEKSQDFSDKIEEIQKKISKKRKESKATASDMDALMCLGKAYTELKDGFREVKSYVFQGVLQELNRKANKYLTELFEVPVKLMFSNTSEEGDISKIFCSVTIEGVERPLGLYSGGQFRRIQLAVDFALSDVIGARSDRPINLIVLDEAFKDLSSTSMEKVLNLLTSMKKNAILIEHNEVFKSVVSNVFEVEYRDGTSRRIDS